MYTDNQFRRRCTHVCVLALSLLVARSVSAQVRSQPESTQAVAPQRSSNVPRSNDEQSVLVMNPFVVDAESDTGYAASSTLAGSRFRTDLRDVAASISVITSDFMGDLGANNLEQAMRYSNNTQMDNASAGTDSRQPNGNSYQEGAPSFIVRGLPTTRARNYYTLWLQSDSYNMDRIEDSRGPNSVLFGFGAPGGIINISTKQARTDRSIRKATVQGGANDSHRATLDLNQVLLRGKLGLRLNAVYDQSNQFQHYAFNRDRRLDLAIKYEVTPTMEIRAEYERSKIRVNKPRPFVVADGGVLLWKQLGSQTYAKPIRTNEALSVTQISTRRRWLDYVSNNGALMENSGMLTTFNPSSADLRSILDSSFADYSINYGGPGQINNIEQNWFNLTGQKRFGDSTYLEVSYNHQDNLGVNINPGQTNYKIFADPNQFLKDGKTPNPFVGQMFMENSSNAWERNQTSRSSDLGRITVSSDLNLGIWGKYRIAALGEYDSRTERVDRRHEYWKGYPFNSIPQDAANLVRRRTYITPGDWSTYYINSPVTTGLLHDIKDPVTGQLLSSFWGVYRSSSLEDDPATQVSAVLAAQAKYWSDRIVVSGGYRYDRLEILDRTAGLDPKTAEWTLDYATSNVMSATARNTSMGVVVHVTDNIALYYNRANNQGLGGGQRLIDVNNLNGPPIGSPTSKGQGQDFGITLALWGGKVNLRLNRYTTDAKDLSDAFSPTGIGPDKVSKNILEALYDEKLITQDIVNTRTTTANGILFDFESRGYEFALTANPTKNWRLQANFSYTDMKTSNYGSEIVTWMNHEIAYWRSFNRGGTVTGSGATIDEAIKYMTDGFNQLVAVAGMGELGLRKYKVSFFTRYDLPAGFYMGGGYRHQSKSLAGTDETETVPLYGNSYWRADALLGYTFPKSALQYFGIFFKDLSIQLNVYNVFDEHDPLITRYQPDGIGALRAVVQEPRSWRLQASMSF